MMSSTLHKILLLKTGTLGSKMSLNLIFILPILEIQVGFHWREEIELHIRFLHPFWHALGLGPDILLEAISRLSHDGTLSLFS